MRHMRERQYMYMRFELVAGSTGLRAYWHDSTVCIAKPGQAWPTISVMLLVMQSEGVVEGGVGITA